MQDLLPSSRAWGREMASKALELWAEYSGETIHPMPELARVDGVCVSEGNDPAFVEVKARQHPFTLFPDVPLNRNVYGDLTRLQYYTQVDVVWLVVWSDCAGYLVFPTAPRPFRESGDKVFFAREAFSLVPQATFEKYFPAE